MVPLAWLGLHIEKGHNDDSTERSTNNGYDRSVINNWTLEKKPISVCKKNVIKKVLLELNYKN